MSRSSRLTLAVVLGAMVLADPAPAAVSEDQAERIALDTVKRVGGSVEGPAKAVRKGDGYWVSIGEGWRVGVSQATGTPTLVVDTAFGESPHAKHVLGAQPTSAEIDAAGREVVAKVLPDFDMAEMELESAIVQPRSACAEARWRQVIVENGFHGPGMCWVVFCWPDRAVKSLSTRDPSTPREWRRPATVTAERAEEIARPKLGDLNGGWVETRKRFCGFPDAKHQGPVWDVTVLFGPENDQRKSCPDRSVYVDPWSGEITYTSRWDSAAPAGAAAASTPPPADAEAERSGHGRWLLAAGAGLLVLALAAAMVCARRRRA